MGRFERFERFEGFERLWQPKMAATETKGLLFVKESVDD
jgi:hypothetical protein